MAYIPPAKPFQNNPAPVGGGAGGALTADFFNDLVAGVDDADTRLTAITPTGGGRAVAKGELTFNVRDYGAVGDGVVDDTAAIQAAIDAAPEGSTVLFPGKHMVTAITLNKRHVTLNGPGTIYNGKLVIGAATGARQDLYYTVDGLRFEYSTLATGNIGIEFLKCRRGLIRGCTFLNTDKSLYVNPLPGAIAHDTAMISIMENEFASVNYALYVDRDDAVTWQHTSDSKFIANTINIAYIDGIYIKSIDGMKIVDNVFFFPAFNSNSPTLKANKRRNIYVGQSDWVHIRGNNLFEAGEEGILLDMAKHFTVASNLIAWPGQKNPYDGIRLTGANQPNGIISDNVVSRFTSNGIGIYTTGSGTIVIKDNVLEYDPATATYYGATPLANVSHYGTYQDPASTDTVIEAGNEITGGGLYNNSKGSLLSGLRGNRDVGFSATYKAVTVTAANTPVFPLTSVRRGTTTWSGLLLIEVKSSIGENTNLSSYLFHVSKHPLGSSITKMSEQGLLAGGSANHPSFDFTIDTAGTLLATPRASTAGTFQFYATYMGNLLAL